MELLIAIPVTALVTLYIRKWITKQPLLKASVDSWVDYAAKYAKERANPPGQ